MFLISVRSCSVKFEFYTRNDSHKQSSLLDTMFIYIFFLELQENIYKKVEKIDYPSASFTGRRIVGFGDLSIDIFLELRSHFGSRILP